MSEYRQGVLHIGGASAPALLERFGSPLYAYDEGVIRRQIGRLRSAFAALPFRPFYAMKANDNLEILRLLSAEGFGCDAVSPGEVFRALRAGFTADRVWFTCSNAADSDFTDLPDERIVVNVNGMSDIDRCIRLHVRNPIAIRVNPDFGAGHHKDVITGGLGVKFGIDLAEVPSARDYAESHGMTVVGLHAHIGSGVTDYDPLVRSAKTLLALAESFPDLQWINFGGGMGVPYRPGEEEFELAEYGAAITELAGPVLERLGVTCILEPGRYVVAQSGFLLTSVTSWRISAGNEWIGCDTGFNHLARPSKYGAYHHILNASRGESSHLRESFLADASMQPAIVAGNLCESGDVFTRDERGIAPRLLPPIREGDALAFCDAGAYGFSMASHYNARLLPAEVLVKDGVARLIRRRQRYEDLTALEMNL